MRNKLRAGAAPVEVALASLLLLAVTTFTACTLQQPGATDAGPTASPTPAAQSPAPSPSSQMSDFPDASNTGVPAGTPLTRSGSLTIEEDGAVIEGLEIVGSVKVLADNVVIRNSRILGTARTPLKVKGANLLVEDTEIDGQGKANPVLGSSDYTLRRVHIHNVVEGPRIDGGNVTIEDSYIHSLIDDDKTHGDVIQVLSGKNINIHGNNLQAYNPDLGYPANAAFQFGEEHGRVRNCVVENNLMNGGNYTINGGGGGSEGAECTFRNNVFQENYRYGVRANLGPNVTWDKTSNVLLGTVEPAK
ncbi:hypothetical protein FE374_04080 [Georgenia yuyongxinii]|uniref:Right handed beta helix domain-containing protein n=1 Tax=Georgenia yuyongxinii TaxID=2589797 RepID=A0A5B8C1J3_9MICO|nr:hypothetical protein [Georgenia yuyongxinii]QDC23920.1 hypothetical protein FE374_04080 [Georgenia yuyongxinii]